MTRRDVHDEGGPPAEDDAGLGAELVAVVAGARRRALRDGDRQIDTAHLLHSLLESDPEVRAAVGTAPQLARLLGYLVQRSIGYGLRWQSGVENSGAGPGAGAPVPLPRRTRRGGEPGGAGDWSPAAAAAMEDARRRARQRGEPLARGRDLLASLVVDPASRAVEVLERAGVPAAGLRARIESGAGEFTGTGAAERTDGGAAR
ncbi:Clp protease N-terminal domain-containing protein [Streptomyces sp. NPDC090108]|uniref:Clp protease N-terminal domain-containing protein n=1 Tax=Streptomyces sp. NPDC090108 TaxID=3365947 RepID=UPI00382CBC00